MTLLTYVARTARGGALVTALCAACHTTPRAVSTQKEIFAARRIANLHALARLYGVVRWFHPSDAAAAIDWDRFATDCVRMVIDAPDPVRLEQRLQKLFTPIAPTLRITHDHVGHNASGTKPNYAGAGLVAWQHLGFGDSSVGTTYQKKRTNRPLLIPAHGVAAAIVSQSVDATDFRGAQIRLRGKAKTANHGLAQLWLRVDRGEGTGFFDNMSDRPGAGDQWNDLEITGSVATDATRVAFGILKFDVGISWFDDIRLDVKVGDQAWKPVVIADQGFEASEIQSAWQLGHVGRIMSTQGWRVERDVSSAAEGKASLRVERELVETTTELFEGTPSPGEEYEIELGQGLRAQVPISLASSDAALASTLVQVENTTVKATNTSFDSAAGIADVIVAWNALQHFWPYWDLITVDWIKNLDTSLARAIEDRDSKEHQRTLELLSAALPDGHAAVRCPHIEDIGKPPFAADLVEGHIIVTDSDAPELHVGDELIHIDGRQVSNILDDERNLASGTIQWRTARALSRLGLGSSGQNMTLHVRRDAEELTLVVPRHAVGEPAPTRHLYPAIAPLGDDIFYVDLARASMSEVLRIIDKLASARGVVFDTRQQTSDTRPLIPHLLTSNIATTQYFIPKIIRPDHSFRSMAGWQADPWSMEPQAPRFGGRVAFIADATSISLTESVLDAVTYYRLGEIVGAPTAGTTGNLAEISEPSGCFTTFTAMRATHVDGSRFHLVGVKPTIPATRTVAGVRTGRDELVEKALAYVRTGEK